MTPQTVNAVNLPLQNALNFPAAILEPPFFDPKADAAMNYGAIGSIIGHEISHSFDDQGASSMRGGCATGGPGGSRALQSGDGEAGLAVRRLPSAARTDVNGQLTLSENIADVAGLSAAFDGYRRAYRGKPAQQVRAADELTGDQRFFLAFAQVWRTKLHVPRLAPAIHS